jgi:hypothetical protein
MYLPKVDERHYLTSVKSHKLENRIADELSADYCQCSTSQAVEDGQPNGRFVIIKLYVLVAVLVLVTVFFELEGIIVLLEEEKNPDGISNQ